MLYSYKERLLTFLIVCFCGVLFAGSHNIPDEIKDQFFFSDADYLYVFGLVNGTPKVFNVSKEQYLENQTIVFSMNEIMKELRPERLSLFLNDEKSKLNYLNSTMKNAAIVKFLRPVRDLLVKINVDLTFAILLKATAFKEILDVPGTIIELSKLFMHKKRLVIKDISQSLDLLEQITSENINASVRFLNNDSPIMSRGFDRRNGF